MASHRLSEVYRQNKQASTLGYDSKAKTKRAGTAVNLLNQPDAAAVLDSQRVLRQFDLSAKFGPCTNLTRKQRWERAHALGLNPPENVRVILEQMEMGHQEQQGIWANRI